MLAHWSAPYRPHWKMWSWPCETSFWEVYEAKDLEGLPPVGILYANPNAHYVLDMAALEMLPDLKMVVTPSTGNTHIDMLALREAGVELRSLLDDRPALEEIRASSEFTFLLILNALRRLDKMLLSGEWKRDEESLRGHELYEAMIGLVGHGRIGKNVERWCREFGAGVYWYDPYDDARDNIYQCSIPWQFSNCHVVVLCCSLTAETRGSITGQMVYRMRPNATLINTARGELLADDVYDALRKRQDVTAWFDVLPGEASGGPEQAYLELPNVHVTPHIAGTTFESQEKAARIAMQLAGRWLSAYSKSPA